MMFETAAPRGKMKQILEEEKTEAGKIGRA